jgi:hypothetical protein
MLNELETVRDLGAIVAKAHPDWRPGLIPDRTEPIDHWKFRAALLIAWHSQFQPEIRVSYRTELDSPGSWWCPVEAPSPANGDNISWRLPAAYAPSERVFTSRDTADAQQELTRLHQAGSTEMFLAPIVFDWAKAHSDDPQVPEALYRLVVVTRYGCRNGDPAIGQISKTAFDLLHKKYPQSSWAAKTPYWFK